MHLYAKGVITNRKKGFNEGKLVASAAIGSRNLYDFIDDNPAVDFRPSDYVNDPFVISRHNRMVSINVAKTIDLTGQVAAEASAQTFYAGVSGIADFVSGARRAPSGKSILMLFSTSENGKTSNIVPALGDTAVVVPRGDVHYVVTEYGVVNLFGKSYQERVIAMIEIAHPDFREELFEQAKKSGIIGSERSLGEAVRVSTRSASKKPLKSKTKRSPSVPPNPWTSAAFRSITTTSTRRTFFPVFFHEKTSFARKELESKSQIDYVKDLTLVAVVGEFGFGRVVAVGESMLLVDNNMAEVAFSVNKKYQNKGLSRRIMRKLADAARENGIAGLIAYTAPHNQAMIQLFKTLPYKVKTSYDGEGVYLKCRFDELA